MSSPTQTPKTPKTGHKRAPALTYLTIPDSGPLIGSPPSYKPKSDIESKEQIELVKGVQTSDGKNGAAVVGNEEGSNGNKKESSGKNEMTKDENETKPDKN